MLEDLIEYDCDSKFLTSFKESGGDLGDGVAAVQNIQGREERTQKSVNRIMEDYNFVDPRAANLHIVCVECDKTTIIDLINIEMQW